MRKEDELEQSVMMLMYKNMMKSITLWGNLKYLSGAGEMAERVDALAMQTQWPQFNPQMPQRGKR